MIEIDASYMRRALALARRGGVGTAPNPNVGAVLVNNQRIVGKGWHAQAGGPHAEVVALRTAAGSSSNSTLYVTLEPCNHTGRTAPCAEAIIEAGVGRVVVAMRDPNPGVAGGGVERLLTAGVEVEVGVLEREARLINQPWLKQFSSDESYSEALVFSDLSGTIVEKIEEIDTFAAENIRAFVGRFAKRSVGMEKGPSAERLLQMIQLGSLDRFVLLRANVVLGGRGRGQVSAFEPALASVSERLKLVPARPLGNAVVATYYAREY